MADAGLTAQELVQACNKIIVYAGLISRVANVEEVRVVCSSSSLLVAALEGFLGRRLENVLRTPKTPDERAYNLNIVVDVLSQLLSCELSHISGERIVEGSVEDIANILELLAVVCHGKPLQGPPQGATSPADRLVLDEQATGPHSPTSSQHSRDDSEAQTRERPVNTRRYLRASTDSSTPVHTATSSDIDVESSDYSADGSDGRQAYAQGQNVELSGDGEVPHVQPPQQLLLLPRRRHQQQAQSDDEAGPHQYAPYPQHGERHPGGEGGPERREPEGSVRRPHDGGAPLRAGAVRVRPRGPGRRQRVSLRRAVITAGHIPLSPIQEVSREGTWDNSRASKETPRVQSADMAAMRASEESSRTAAAPHSADGVDVRRSAGGASSLISVPSVAQDVSRRSKSDSHSGSSPQQQQSSRPPAAAEATSAPSSYSEGTSTLLERALSQAEATLRGLGCEYEHLYYNDDEDDLADAIRSSVRRRRRRAHKEQSSQQTCGDAAAAGRGGSIVRRSKPHTYEPTIRALRAAPWLEGPSGRMQQHHAFLSRAGRVLGEGTTATTTTTTTSSGLPPTSASGSGSGSGLQRYSRAKAPSTRSPARGSAPSSAAGGALARADTEADRDRCGGGRGRTAGGGVGHEALVRALRAGVVPEAAVAGKGGKLMQRAPAAPYGSQSQHGGAERVDDVDPRTGVATPHRRRRCLQLNPELEAKLRYLLRLTIEDPRKRAARAAVESMTVADDLMRQARRRALVDRLSNARARKDAALRLTSDRLREQGREYEKRVEQLRLQRLAAEWSASQRSTQMRRALQAELALRDVFMEVLQGEKEVLLAERQDAKADAAAAFPTYKRALRKTESDYQEILGLLERLLVSERQQRMRADQEAEQVQRDFNHLATTVVYDRMQELLARIAREDEATAQRRSIATQPKAKRALMTQIRRVLGLAAR